MKYRMRLLLFFSISTQAFAADILWQGTSNNDMLNLLNWSPNTIPGATDTALFNGTASSTTPTLTGAPVADVGFGSIQFTDNTPYTVGISFAISRRLTLEQMGVSNLGSANQIFSLTGSPSAIRFNNNSSADATGSGRIFYNTNGGRVTFANNATASNANINLGAAGGLLEFFSNSTAANAQISLTGGSSTVTFFNNSTGGNAHITSANNGNIVFTNNSKAQSAQLDISQTTLTFGTNSQANNAVVNAQNGSIVVVKDNATANSATLNIVNSSLLFQNAASGNSATVNLAASQLQFNQNNTLGSLSADSASLIELNAFNLALGNNNANMSIEGVISGIGGSLTKVGTGTLFLNSNNTFTGNTDINAGTLAGTGSVAGDLNINTGAIFSPGNGAIGTFNVGGNYNQNAGSTLQAAVNSTGQSSLVNAFGTANLDGALSVYSPDGLYAVGTEYVVVRGDSGRTGAFSTVTVNNPYFLPTLRYDSDEAFLSLAPNFTPSAAGGNEAAVAEQIDTLTDPTTQELAFINNLAQESLSSLQATLAELSGEQYLGILQIDQKSNDQFLRRLQAFIPFPHDACASRREWWAEFDGGQGRYKTASRHFRTMNWNTYAGFSIPLSSQCVIGAIGNYENNNIHYSLDGHGRINQGRLAVYGIYIEPRFYFALDVFGGYGDCRLRRKIQINAIQETAKSHFSIYSGTFYAEIGKNLCLWGNEVQPFLGLETTHYYRSRAKEHGAGLLNLRIKDNGYTLESTRIGVHIVKASCYGIDILADLAWRHNYDYGTQHAKARFINFGDSFRINSQVVSPNAFEYLVTLSKQLTERISAFVQFAGEYSSNYTDYEIGLGVFTQF